MGKIYKNQTALRMTLIANVDATGYQSAKIKYLKPDGTSGFWSAMIDNTAIGSVFHDFSLPTELDQSGVWTVWAYITFSDSREAAGEPVKVTVFEEGKN